MTKQHQATVLAASNQKKVGDTNITPSVPGTQKKMMEPRRFEHLPYRYITPWLVIFA